MRFWGDLNILSQVWWRPLHLISPGQWSLVIFQVQLNVDELLWLIGQTQTNQNTESRNPQSLIFVLSSSFFSLTVHSISIPLAH